MKKTTTVMIQTAPVGFDLVVCTHLIDRRGVYHWERDDNTDEYACCRNDGPELVTSFGYEIYIQAPARGRKTPIKITILEDGTVTYRTPEGDSW